MLDAIQARTRGVGPLRATIVQDGRQRPGGDEAFAGGSRADVGAGWSFFSAALWPKSGELRSRFVDVGTDLDALGLARAAHRDTRDDGAWLQALVAAASGLDQGLGVMGWTVSSVAMSPVAAVGPSADLVEPLFATIAELRATDESMFAKLQAERAPVALGTETSVRRLGIDLHAQPGYRCALAAGVHDSIVVRGVCPSGLAVVLLAPAPRRLSGDRRGLARWEKVAAHLQSAFRLRRGTWRGLVESADAVLEPDGRVAHLSPRAEVDRESLRRACLVAERSLGASEDDAGPALDAWTALVSGEYSLLDHFDSDGRRYVLAVKNAPDVSGPSALTPRETQVAAYVAMGHPLKYVAYELGLSVASVGKACQSAVTKLGLRSRAELGAVLFGAVERGPNG